MAGQDREMGREKKENVFDLIWNQVLKKKNHKSRKRNCLNKERGPEGEGRRDKRVIEVNTSKVPPCVSMKWPHKIYRATLKTIAQGLERWPRFLQC